MESTSHFGQRVCRQVASAAGAEGQQASRIMGKSAAGASVLVRMRQEAGSLDGSSASQGDVLVLGLGLVLLATTIMSSDAL